MAETEEAQAPSASLVEAVLACSGRLEKEGLSGRIARLSGRVEELKVGGAGKVWAGLN